MRLLIHKQKVKQGACLEGFMPEPLDTKGWLSYTGNIRNLFKSQRLTDDAFRIVGVVAIDKRCSMLYSGSMESLFGRFGAKVAYRGIYAK
jgi:hypothetical protein